MRRTLSVLLAVLWLGSGCAGSPAPSARVTQEEAASAPAARPGRMLVAAVRVEPVTVAALVVGQNLSIPSHLARRMFNADLALLDQEGEPHPYLAESLPQLNTSWRVSDTGSMVTTYRLKPNLFWHDGRALNADEFVFSWQIYARPEFGSAGSPPISLIESVEAPDDRTIVIRWTRPYPAAGALQSTGAGATGLPPLPRFILGPATDAGTEALLNNPYWTAGFVGLGPYRLDLWEPGAFFEATAFDRHALGVPRIPRIKVVFMGDGNTTLASMLAGEVHLATDSGMNSRQISELLRQWPPGDGTMISQSRNWKAAHFQARPDYANPTALRDLRVRRSLAYAVDRDGINVALNEGQDLMSDSLFPPTSELGRATNAAVTKYPFDPRQSAQLMTEAGFSRGSDGIYTSPVGGRLSAELMSSASDVGELAAIASGWRQAGFEFQEYATPAALAQDVRHRSTYSGIQIITSSLGERGIVSLSSGSIPGPENGWRSVGSSNSYSGYSSPTIDRLVVTYQTALERTERMRAAVEIARQMDADFPAIPLFFPTTQWVFTSELSGPMSGGPESNMSWNMHQWEFNER